MLKITIYHFQLLSLIFAYNYEYLTKNDRPGVLYKEVIISTNLRFEGIKLPSNCHTDILKMIWWEL